MQHEIVSPPGFAGESFTVVAARGADDMWVEVRRRKVVADGVPETSFEPTAQRLAIAATVRRGAEAGSLRRSAVTPPPSSAGAKTRPASEPGPESVMTILSAMVSPMAPVAAPTPTEPIAGPPPAIVVPMSRSSARSESASAAAAETQPALDRLLRRAAARGASTLYLSSNAPPSVRVDGEVQTLDGEPSLGAHDVESLLLTVIPDRDDEAPPKWCRERVDQRRRGRRARALPDLPRSTRAGRRVSHHAGPSDIHRATRAVARGGIASRSSLEGSSSSPAHGRAASAPRSRRLSTS